MRKIAQKILGLVLAFVLSLCIIPQVDFLATPNAPVFIVPPPGSSSWDRMTLDAEPLEIDVRPNGWLMYCCYGTPWPRPLGCFSDITVSVGTTISLENLGLGSGFSYLVLTPIHLDRTYDVFDFNNQIYKRTEFNGNPASYTFNTPGRIYGYSFDKGAWIRFHVVAEYCSPVEYHDWLAGLFSQPSHTYNHELATFAAELSYLAYNTTQLHTRLRSKDIVNIDTITLSGNALIEFEFLEFTFATRSIERANRTYDLVFVVVRGSAAAGDWWDNLRLGFWTGEHPGFRDVRNYVSVRLHQFLNSHTDDPERTIVLMTGHSRGGAVANLLASGLNRNDEFRTNNLFTYTFASPNVTTSRETNFSIHRNIFNIINRNDIVPTIPPGYSRYGVDMPVTMPVRAADGFLGYMWAGAATASPIPGINGHAMEVYRSWMESNPGLTYGEFRRLDERRSPVTLRPPIPRLIIWNCPIDIVIYNNNGDVVAKILDNEPINFYDSYVFTFVIDDVKHAFLPYGDIYTIRIIATDYGTMTFTVEDIDVMGIVQVERKEFTTVSLYPGREMISEIASSIPDVQLLLVENGEVVGEIATDGTLARQPQPQPSPVQQQEPTPPPPTKIIRFTIGNVAFAYGETPMQGDIAAPFIDAASNRTMVPLRTIASSLGAHVSFNDATRTVYIVQNGQILSLPIGTPLSDGMGTPVIINDRTFVPVRYVSEALGATVRWDGANQAVYIYR